MSHLRAMAPTWDYTDPYAGHREAVWLGFLVHYDLRECIVLVSLNSLQCSQMLEALTATALRKPVLMCV